MKRLSLMMLSAIVVLAMFANDEIYQSNKVDTFPTLKSNYEWGETLYPIEDGKCFVGLLNNSDGLYFKVIVKDRRLQSQLLRRGFTIYFDTNGKKKQKYAIVFPNLEPMNRVREKMSKERESRDEYGDEEHFGERGTLIERQEDSDTLTNDLKQHRRGDFRHRNVEQRAAQLKGLIGRLASSPVVFKSSKDESIMAQDLAGINTEGNNLTYQGFISYNQLGKLGKKGLISLGLFLSESDKSTDREMNGFQNGMPGPPPGMMGGGAGMMPPPEMGGPRGFENSNSEKMQKNTEKFAIWLCYSIK